jgi:cytochrome c nitrite reductase small subunit
MKLSFLVPPQKWRVPVIITLGVLTGLVFFVLHISKADSYLSDNPETCINCHVMFPQYASWQHSSHARVANCNDCHVPHNNFINKYYFKAKDGLRHTTIFTLRLEPQVIRIKEAGREVVQGNCERCHENLITHIELYRNQTEEEENERPCWECHRETPHGRINSLSSFPYARVPKLSPILPEWLQKKEK